MSPRFEDSFEFYPDVDLDFRQSLWLYMMYGIDLGSFGMAVLRNDFHDAMNRAHRALTAARLRALTNWLYDNAPRISYGSEQNIITWKSLSDEQRRDILIECGLRPSVVDVLKGELP